MQVMELEIKQELERNRAVREVTSNQAGVLENVEQLVLRYVNSEFRRPLAAHTVEAFEKANEFVKVSGKTVVLDSGCGTGRSSFALAAKFHDSVVVAVDKSAVRLTKAALQNEECVELAKRIFFVRGELLDFWRLVKDAGWNIVHHAVYYPNPWPKSNEATRRFHLSPVFPTMLKLSPVTELRTNWKIYAEEFAMAARIAGKAMSMPLHAELSAFVPITPETAFEEKYSGAGQTLYKVLVNRMADK